MLVEFRVTNFRSIRDTLTFSFVKGAEKDTENTNSFKPKAPNSPSLLKSAAIYGPNAAGKSNIIRALSVMQDFVLESSSKYQAGETLPFTPFLLDENTSNEPSEFEVTLISKGVRYQYGFAATESHILEEWLFAYPKGSSQQWIDRTYDVRTGETIWGGMSGLTGGKNIWKKTTRNNALFLSTAIQLNSEQLLPIFDWFEKTLHVLVDGIMSPAYSASKCKSTPDKEKILNFLKSADLGISDLEVDETEFDETFLPDDMRSEERRVGKE